MRKIKLQTLGIELYKFTRMHTTVQLSHFLTNEWKSFMSLSYKELAKRREAIAAMTCRWLKHLSHISTCDPVTDRNQDQDSLIGSLECYPGPQFLTDISCSAWLSRLLWIFLLFCPFIFSWALWLVFWTVDLLWAGMLKIFCEVYFGFIWYTCCTTSWKLVKSWPSLSFWFFLTDEVVSLLC